MNKLDVLRLGYPDDRRIEFGFQDMYNRQGMEKISKRAQLDDQDPAPMGNYLVSRHIHKKLFDDGYG